MFVLAYAFAFFKIVVFGAHSPMFWRFWLLCCVFRASAVLMWMCLACFLFWAFSSSVARLIIECRVPALLSALLDCETLWVAFIHVVAPQIVFPIFWSRVSTTGVSVPRRNCCCLIYTLETVCAEATPGLWTRLFQRITGRNPSTSRDLAMITRSLRIWTKLWMEHHQALSASNSGVRLGFRSVLSFEEGRGEIFMVTGYNPKMATLEPNLSDTVEEWWHDSGPDVFDSAAGGYLCRGPDIEENNAVGPSGPVARLSRPVKE